MTFPNFVIGGAPKCGTSSLFSWLADHPQVCGSSVKEPFFLMDEGNPMLRKACNVHDHGIEAYSSFFRGCAGERVVVADVPLLFEAGLEGEFDLVVVVDAAEAGLR